MVDTNDASAEARDSNRSASRTGLLGLWDILYSAAFEWHNDKAPKLGAALAFYSVLSLAPLLVIAIAVAGVVFGEEAARGELMSQLRLLVGEQGADAVDAMLESARSRPRAGVLASLLGIGTLVFAATGVFGELQDSLNAIWDVKAKEGRGFWGVVHDRLLSFGMVLAIGFLLLVSLVVSTLLASLNGLLRTSVPVGAGTFLQFGELLVSFLVVTLLFALMYRFLPDVRMRWRDVWLGAAVTSILFAAGKNLIGLYLGQASIASSYGAAGSFVVLLLWIYYSAQIVFYGAEITQVYAKRGGHHVTPTPNAEPAEHAPAKSEAAASV